VRRSPRVEIGLEMTCSRAAPGALQLAAGLVALDLELAQPCARGRQRGAVVLVLEPGDHLALLHLRAFVTPRKLSRPNTLAETDALVRRRRIRWR
jgi:hypothetical protein